MQLKRQATFAFVRNLSLSVAMIPRFAFISPEYSGSACDKEAFWNEIALNGERGPLLPEA